LQIGQLLRNTTSAAPLGQYDGGADLRLSIAGAQEKTALLRHDEQWIYPAGSTPTTHIFKLPLGLVGNMQADMRTSIENEWLCSKIVSAYGLPAANCIFHLPGGLYRSTPLYDVLSAHPIIGPGRNQIARQKVKMAMAVRGSTNHYLIEKIQRRHWIEQARRVGLGSETAQDIIAEVVNETDDVISAVDALVPSGFPDGLAESILGGVGRQRDRLIAASRPREDARSPRN
jgi:serine/threonine-protein kinase HipA